MYGQLISKVTEQGKKVVFTTNGARTIGYLPETENKLQFFLTTYIKINSQ